MTMSFFQRRECQVLLDYIRAAASLDEAVSEQSIEWLLEIANLPPRELPCQALGQVLRMARYQKSTMRQTLMGLAEHPEFSSHPSQQSVGGLVALLDALRSKLGNTSTGDLLAWLVNELRYFDDLEGVGSLGLRHTVMSFAEYAGDVGLGPMQFIKHITELNTGRGVPQDQQIALSTIHRQKGAEYDHIFLPDCTEGFLPCLHEEGNLIYDKSGTVKVPSCSSSVESERRLFYTGITRARKAVYIGTSEPVVDGNTSRSPSRFVGELELEPTVHTMGPLQQLASGVNEARDDLLTAVRRFGGIRKITKNLVAEYLQDIGDEAVAAEVSKVVASMPDVPFGYRFPLTPPTIPGGVKPQPARALHRVWDSVAF